MKWIKLTNSGSFSVVVVWGLLLSSTMAAPATESLVIRASPSSATLLAGEPFVLSARFGGVSALYLDDLSKDNEHFRVLIDRGSGFSVYVAPSFGSAWIDAKKKPLKNKEATFDYTLAYDKAIEDWVFPAAGTFQLVLEYRDAEIGTVRSNVVTISVIAPDAEERDVQQALRRLGSLVVATSDPAPLQPAVAALVEDHPTSVYLHRLRVNDLLYRTLKASEGIDPDEPGSMPKDAEAKAHRSRQQRSRLLALARELSEVESAFTPDALLLLADLQEEVGDAEGRKDTLKKVVRDFPQRALAREADQQLAELASR